ncbi:MAG: signal peptide peptidase SppA [Deltaproteobacteria bacterium]|nr:signal peptide peptidase SppA [Deltaproteobacteria bacterium]
MKQYFVWLAKLLTLVVIFFVVVPLLMGGVLLATQKEMGSVSPEGDKLVAVIELNGIIESGKDIVEELHKQAADDKVKGIVLRINSPGGAVGPSQDIFSTVLKLKKKKPIVASMGSLAASGGLYSALGASKIYAQPGTLTGSIGVIMQLPNFTKIADKVGFEMVTVKSGKFKDVGNSFREMTPEDRAFLENTIARVQDEFVQAVATGRNLSVEKVRTFADGRVILGSQAKELKLIDEIGDVYDAARAVFDLRNEPLKSEEEPNIFYPMDKFGQFKRFFESISSIPQLFSRSMELRYMMP